MLGFAFGSPPDSQENAAAFSWETRQPARDIGFACFCQSAEDFRVEQLYPPEKWHNPTLEHRHSKGQEKTCATSREKAINSPAPKQRKNRTKAGKRQHPKQNNRAKKTAQKPENNKKIL